MLNLQVSSSPEIVRLAYCHPSFKEHSTHKALNAVFNLVQKSKRIKRNRTEKNQMLERNNKQTQNALKFKAPRAV